MRIATRLRIISTITVIALIVMAPVLVLSSIEFRHARNDYVLANTIKTEFFERASYRDQYFLYREDHARKQWAAASAHADRLLREGEQQFRRAADRELLARLRDQFEESSAIFERIAANTQAMTANAPNRRIYEELDKRLYNQSLLRSAALRDLASALEEASAQRVERTYRQLLAMIGLFAATLALATILASRNIIRLLRERVIPLHNGARVIADGDLSHRIATRGVDEFDELALSINAMTDRLQTFTRQLEAEIAGHRLAEDALRDSEDKLHAVLNAAEVGIAWANETGTIEYVNPKFSSLFGYTLIDVPDIEQWYLHAYPDPDYRKAAVAEWDARIARSLPARTALEPMELDIACKDGSVRHVLLMGSWAGSRLLANFSDITERKRAEEALRKESEKNMALLRNASDGIHILDADGNVIEASDSFCAMLGYTRDEIIGMNVAAWDAQFSDEERTQKVREQFALKQRTQFVTRHKRKDGSVFDVEVSGFPLVLDGKPVLFNSSRDISIRKRAEDNLRRSEANLRAILDNSPYLVWLKDMEGRFIAVNHAFFNTTGLERMQDVLGKTDFDLWPDSLARKYRADDLDVLTTRKQKLTEEMSIDKGEIRWVETFKAPIMDRDGNLLGTTGFAQDITTRKNAEMQIRHLAHYDPLTDLPNRALFSDRLQQALAASRRDRSGLALIFLDLDKFKPINDSLGHHVGDLLLREAAKRMQDCVRETDTVARIGGDEFLVLLPTVASGSDAMHVAEKIRRALNEPFNLVGQSLYISSSAGIALYPAHGQDETQLVKHADVAMYHAKEGGRNSVVLYRPGMEGA